MQQTDLSVFRFCYQSTGTLVYHLMGNSDMKRYFSILFLLLCSLPVLAKAITVHDMLGRDVEIKQPVRSLFLADSRDILALDIVSGDKFFQHIVGWSDSLPQFAPDMLAAYLQRYPAMKNIPVVGKSGTDLSIETIIKLKPDVVIANSKSYHMFSEINAISRLQESGIQTVFVDFMQDITINTPKSMQLLADILQEPERVRQFNQIYNQRISLITDRVEQLTDKPSVLVEYHAGLTGLEDCCHLGGSGSSGFGQLVVKAGTVNLLMDKTSAQNSQANLEGLLSMNPHYYIMTGADWTGYEKKSVAVALGYQADLAILQQQFNKLLGRKIFNQLDAVKQHHVMVLYHHFYDNPLNYIAIEAMAKFFHPQQFADLDPEADLRDIHQQFISIAADGIFWLEK